MHAVTPLLPPTQIEEATRLEIAQQRLDPLALAIADHRLHPQVVDLLLACGLRPNAQHFSTAMSQSLNLVYRLIKGTQSREEVGNALSLAAQHVQSPEAQQFLMKVMLEMDTLINWNAEALLVP